MLGPNLPKPLPPKGRIPPQFRPDRPKPKPPATPNPRPEPAAEYPALDEVQVASLDKSGIERRLASSRKALRAVNVALDPLLTTKARIERERKLLRERLAATNGTAS